MLTMISITRRLAYPLLAAATIGAAAGVAGCARESSANEAATPAAAAAKTSARTLSLSSQDVATVTLADIGNAVTMSGPLQPAQTVNLRAQVNGTVSELRVDRGTRVRRGQRLATIRAAGVTSQVAGARASVTAAEAAAAVARKEMESARTLYEAGAISAIERQGAEARYEAAAAQIAAARAQVASAGEAAGFTAIVAPMDGVVSDRVRENGESVAPGDEILTIVDPRMLELSAQIGVADAGRVRVGQSVAFTLDAFPGESFTGRVARIDPVADAGTRQVGVYVELVNRDGRIIGGQYARGRITLGTQRGLVIPSTAVRDVTADGTSGSVFVVESGRLVRRAVALGTRDEVAGTVAVTNGLKEGEQVIVTTTTDVAEGTMVRLAEPAPSKDTAR